MYESGTRLAQEVRADVCDFIAAAQPDDAWHGARVFDTVIRRNVKLAECPSFGQTVFDYAPSSHGAQDYAALGQELLAPPAFAKSTVTGRVSRPAEDVVPGEPAAFVPPAPTHPSPAPAPADMPAAGPQP
jgi:hypothetical protein